MSAPDRDVAADVDALLARTIGALSGGASSGSAESVGRSGDGRVTATLAGSALRGLELDPTVLRDGPDALARSVIEAVNAAVDNRPADSGSQAAELRAIKDASLDQSVRLRSELQTQLAVLADGARDADPRDGGNR